MWGHPALVLGAISSFLEPFRGYLSPKVEKISEELTLRYPHEEPCVAGIQEAGPSDVGWGRERRAAGQVRNRRGVRGQPGRSMIQLSGVSEHHGDVGEDAQGHGHRAPCQRAEAPDGHIRGNAPFRQQGGVAGGDGQAILGSAATRRARTRGSDPG